MDARERIDLRLAFIEGEIADLAETLPEWGEISDNERGIWEFEWPSDLSTLNLLQSYRDAGELSAEQERRYEELLARLRGLAPEIQRTLRLRVPPAVLEDLEE